MGRAVRSLWRVETGAMIRRELAADGQHPARWVLISQIDHADLAGRLAEHWDEMQNFPGETRAALLWAIEHHDDGWRAWETAPGIDAESGVPRSFTEMEGDVAAAIWSKSIETAREAGPLQAYVVAGHFCALARRATHRKKSDPAWQSVREFLERYEPQMGGWLASWQAERPATNGQEVADRALAYLQFFDALSLWFCCAEPSGPDVVETPDGPELTLVPQAAGHVGLQPWPFDVGSMNLEVPGRVVAVGHFASREALAAAPSEQTVLRWHLAPVG